MLVFYSIHSRSFPKEKVINEHRIHRVFILFHLSPEALFDKSRRPLDAGFYTGSPAYHSLVYQIFEQGGKLSLPLEPEKEVSELPAIVKELEDRIAASSGQSSTTEEVNTTEEVRKEEELFPSPVATEVQEEEGLSPSPVATEVQEEEGLSPSPVTTEVQEEEGLSPSPVATEVQEEEGLSPSPVETEVQEEERLSPSPVVTEVQEEEGLSPSPVETEVQEEEGLSPSPAEVQEEEGLSPSPVTAEVQEEEGLSPSPVTTEVQENVQQDLPKTWIKKEAMENIIAEELSDKQVINKRSRQILYSTKKRGHTTCYLCSIRTSV